MALRGTNIKITMRRVFSLYFLLTAAVLVHSFILGQQPSKREQPTSFLVQLGYLKADSIYSASSTCASGSVCSIYP